MLIGVRYDQEKEDKAEWEAKQKELQRIEDAKKAEADKGDKPDTLNSTSESNAQELSLVYHQFCKIVQLGPFKVISALTISWFSQLYTSRPASNRVKH